MSPSQARPKEPKRVERTLKCPRCGGSVRTPFCPSCGTKVTADGEITRGLRSDAASFDRLGEFAREGRVSKGKAFSLLTEFATEDLLDLANHATHGNITAALGLLKGFAKDFLNGGAFSRRVLDIIMKEEANPEYAIKKVLAELGQQRKAEDKDK